MKEKLKSFLTRGDERSLKAKWNVIGALLIRGFSILISLILVPLTLGYLNSYEYGVWLTLSSILLWINYFDIGLGNGLRNKLAESIALGDKALGQIYVSTCFYFLILIIICVFLIFCILNYWLNWNEVLNIPIGSIPNINSLVSIVFSLFCISFVFKFVGNIYLAYQLPVINDLLSLGGSLLSLILIYVLTLTTDGSITKVAFVFSFSPVLIYLIAYPYTFYIKYKELRPSIKKIRLVYAKDLMGLGVKFFLLQVACLVIFSTSNLLVSHLFTPAAVTPYNIAFKYFSIVTMIFSILINPLWSAITDAYVKKDIEWIRRSIKTMFRIWLVCVITIVVMILMSNYIYHMWIGNEVSVPIQLSVSMGVYAVVFTWNQIFASFSNGIGQVKLQLWCAIIASILYIPIAYILSKFLNVESIVYAMVIVLSISAIVLPYQYKVIINKYK